ncbi:GTPase IMAP family member 8-like [Pelmatolapia mariae]|uniref:GTPase IMAP family member 8-like n=1 Tax=Pelmatolapia mariae TaxID=158779 RepID=UPI003211EEB9
MASSPDLTVMLLGNTGVGKSASGNTILGYDAFESKPSFRSVTRKINEATERVFGKQISIIDTPGILDFKEEIERWCQDLLRSSRPCLFLLVISVGRFTREQEKAVRETISVLRVEDDGLEKSYILFTNGDGLKEKTVEDFIFEDDESSLPDIVKEFKGKYHLFNNETGEREQVKQLLIVSGHLQTTDQQSQLSGASCGAFGRPRDTRVFLIGLPEGGKSSTGNTILGCKMFSTDCDFNAVCTEIVSKSAEVEDHWLTVVDTPGFTDEKLTPKQLYMELTNTFVKASPGPHAFVIVVKIGKMSKANTTLLQILQQLFGSGAKNYAMVLFTHGDKLKGQSIDEMIQSNRCVSELVSMCGGRFCVFDNTKRGNRRQVQTLMNEIDDIVKANGGGHYTSEMFQMAETFIREAERTQHSQADSNDSPQQTAQRRMLPFCQRLWKDNCSSFLACFCCCGSTTDSDDDQQPLLQT